MRFTCSTFTMLLGLSVLSAWAAEYKVPYETVLYYPFDTTTTALESFGAAKAALAQGRGNVAFSSKGHAGGCLYFDGEATLTLEKLPEGMPLGRSPYTVSAWVRADRTKEFVPTGGWLGYGVRGEKGAGNSYRHNGEDGVQNYWNWRDLNVRTPALADGSWHHVAGTWDGETRRLYYDGRLAGSDRQTPNVKWGPLVIGATINDRPYTGWIDDVLVARRAFSDEEIAALHRAGIPGTDVAADGSSDGRLLAGDAFVTRAELDKARSREMAVTAKWLLLPVKNGARMCKVRVLVGEKTFREFDIELAPGEPDWYAALDVSSLNGGRLTLRVDGASTGSKTLDRVRFSDEAPVPDGYDGASRPQFHFSPARGWMNDPNGLSYYNGEWHLFFQHNPYGVNWGNMHWGHAVSKDLFHWREVGEALYPCALGAMFSGSAVVDGNNTAGFGRNAHVLTFTGTAAGSTQGIAYGFDGLNYKKWTGNPAVPNITGGNRDPRVFWYKPGRHWVLALYVAEKGRHNVVIFNSPDLKSWKRVGTIPGDRSGEGRFLYECPELFELRVEGENISRWVVFGANGVYSIGAFDGKTFTPECDRLILNRPIRGCGYYAAQTFGDVPDGRRILLAWFRTHMPGMAFSQSMGIPLELKLVRTSNGLRLAEFPVKEVESLRMGHAVPLSEFDGELVEAFIDMRVRPTGTVRFSLRGIPLAYDAAQETLEVDGVHTAWPLAKGRFKARLFIDRTGLEVFSLDGLVGLPVNNARATSSERRLRIVDGAQHVLEDESRAFKLKSVWHAGAAEEVNRLSAAERAEGWRLLWDGTSFAGWVRADGKTPAGEGWEIKDGVLSIQARRTWVGDGKWEWKPIPGARAKGGMDICTQEKFRDFHLKVDFRLPRAANSGIKYFYNPERNAGTATEYQLLDPAHPAPPNVTAEAFANKRLAALYFFYPAPTAASVLKPCGEWNTAEVISKGRHVEHWLNGVKVLEYTRGDEKFRAAFTKTKWNKPKFLEGGTWGEAPEGRILLQDHDDPVSFRNIKIKAL